MREHYDALETRSPEQREAEHMAALPQQIAHAQRSTTAFAEILSGVDAASITSRDALAQLPVIRKDQLRDRQNRAQAAGENPFGGFSTVGWRTLGAHPTARRVFQSPGSIY